MPDADPWPLLGAASAVGLAVWAATGLVLRLLTRLQLYDRPNERSSHAVATPRGGGLALVPLLLGSWVTWRLWAGAAPAGFGPVLLGAVILALVSLADDLRGLSAVLRLAVQAGAVAVGLIGLGTAGPVFQGLLPPLADRLAAAVLWLWFINLFNFMDGIDGISGVEAVSIGLGLALVALLGGLAAGLVALPILLSAGALGFLAWNWPPARLFLGDVGSIPLGYLLGWLLLATAAQGQWAAALILPLYYLADATATLAKRGLRGAKIWRAHREHYYQRAAQGGLSHGAVVLRVLSCNVALVAFALLAAAGWPWPALAGATLAVLVLLARLAHHAAGRP
jgi:UDP-N-acetylmuramyl pentapeptide phosphotransferase/UDP-N-acetylglucosamine-1-phosphate transferase